MTNQLSGSTGVTDNLEFADLCLGSQVIPAVRVKLGPRVFREVYGGLFTFYLVAGLAC